MVFFVSVSHAPTSLISFLHNIHHLCHSLLEALVLNSPKPFIDVVHIKRTHSTSFSTHEVQRRCRKDRFMCIYDHPIAAFWSRCIRQHLPTSGDYAHQTLSLPCEDADLGLGRRVLSIHGFDRVRAFGLVERLVIDLRACCGVLHANVPLVGPEWVGGLDENPLAFEKVLKVRVES